MHKPFSLALEWTSVAPDTGVCVGEDCRAPLACEAVLVEHAFEAAEGRREKGRLGTLTYRFKTADVMSQNGTVYPRPVYEAAVMELSRRVEAGRVFGANDHPGARRGWELDVRLEDASTRIVAVEMLPEGGDADVQVVQHILDNPHGEQLASIIRSGGRPGLSQRGTARFEEALPDEATTYGAGEDDVVLVARRLRLLTYDNVSEPSFTGATDPSVTEARSMTITLADLKAKHPDLYTQVIEIGKAQAPSLEAQIATAIEDRKADLVAEATAPLTAKITELTDGNEKLTSALEAIKPVLVEHGIVNEQITDEAARTRVAALESEKSTLESTLAAEKQARETATTELAALKLASQATAATEAVRAQYKDSKHLDLILKHVEGEADAAKALESAKAKHDEIATIVAGVRPGTVNTNENPAGGAGDNANEDATKGQKAAGVLDFATSAL